MRRQPRTYIQQMGGGDPGPPDPSGDPLDYLIVAVPGDYPTVQDAYNANYNDAQLLGNGGVKTLRIDREWSATPILDGLQIPRGNRQESVEVRYETGGSLTRVNESYAGDSVTSVFTWTLPSGVESPVFPGDLTVKIDGVTQRLGIDFDVITLPFAIPAIGSQYTSVAPAMADGSGRWQGQIRLIEWYYDNALEYARKRDRPLASGKTLIITSREARCVVISPDSTAFAFEGAYPNPRRAGVDELPENYCLRNVTFVANQWLQGRTGVRMRARNCLIDNCAWAGYSQGFDDAPPYVEHDPYCHTTFLYIKDCNTFGNSSDGLKHALYQSWFGKTVHKNMVSTDTGAGKQHYPGSANKFKGFNVWIDGGFFADNYLCHLTGTIRGSNGTADAGAPEPLSTLSHCKLFMTGATVYRHARSGVDYIITFQQRRTRDIDGYGCNPPVGRTGTYDDVSKNSPTPPPRPTPGDPVYSVGFSNVNHTQVAAGTMTFNWVANPYAHAINSEDDLTVGVQLNNQDRRRLHIPSAYFSATGVGTSSGTVNLSSAVAYINSQWGTSLTNLDNCSVLVSSNYKREWSDFWSAANFWDHFRASAVFETWTADGTTGPIAWSVQTEHLPEAGDFGVWNLTTGAALSHSVSGAGTSGGTITLDAAPTAGDKILITTDLQISAGVAPTNAESPMTRHHGVVNWAAAATTTWGTVRQKFMSDNVFIFGEDIASATNFKMVVSHGLHPILDVPGNITTSLVAPDEWVELSRTALARNVYWGVDPFSQIHSPGGDPHTDGLGWVHGAPVWNVGGDTVDGTAGPSLTLPDWWPTTADIPEKPFA